MSYGGIKVVYSNDVPKDEIWIVDADGKITDKSKISTEKVLTSREIKEKEEDESWSSSWDGRSAEKIKEGIRKGRIFRKLAKIRREGK